VKQRPGSKRAVHPYAQSMLSRARTYGLRAEINSVRKCDTRECILQREAQMYTNTKIRDGAGERPRTRDNRLEADKWRMVQSRAQRNK